jgi:uncharacterized membrane protein YphA (DoxX/SURF4 family)
MLLALAPKKAIVVSPEDLALSTQLLWVFLALAVAFFLVRPELWRRFVLHEIDPRPAGILRITFGIAIFWTLLDLMMVARILFTDEGIYLTDEARRRFGDQMKEAWDPVHGLRHWTDVFIILGSRWSIFYVRSDPSFVYPIYFATMTACAAMILGWRTRLTTLLTFLGVMQIYNYNSLWYAGGDTVTRVMLFVAIFARWGEAYSLDAWRRRRRAILAGAPGVPAFRRIPAWPQRLMMIQLAIIYCATGALKSGVTWGPEGSALYYALNLDHFYRMPMTAAATLLHRVGVLRVTTWVVHVWEVLFPLALVGAALRDWHANRGSTGRDAWPAAPEWRRWLSFGFAAAATLILAKVTAMAARYHYDEKEIDPMLHVGASNVEPLVFVLFAGLAALLVGGYVAVMHFAPKLHRVLLDDVLGKKVWLGIGLGMHVGIDVLMNVGTFVQIMLAVYPAWLSGMEVESFWRWVGSRPLRRGEGERPRRGGLRGVIDVLGTPFAARIDRPTWVILHGSDEVSLRRAALLRCWDVTHRLTFEVDTSISGGKLRVQSPSGEISDGNVAAARLVNVLPGLWGLWLPGLVVELLGRVVAIPEGVRAALGVVPRRLLAQLA